MEKKGGIPWLWIAGIGTFFALAGGTVAVIIYKQRGLRNKNPGNLRNFIEGGWAHWRGAIGVDPQFHLIFEDEEHGIRAIYVNLQAYQNAHGLDTLPEIFDRWAPADDPDAKNDPESYAAHVSKRTGIQLDQRIDTNNMAQMISLARAITKEENTLDPYSDAQYEQAWRLV